MQYKTISKQIDKLPKVHGDYNGLDIDRFIKQTQKNIVRTRLEQAILFDHHKKFKWNWSCYIRVVHKLLEKSAIFKSRYSDHMPISPEHAKINKLISKIKDKYRKDFDELEDTVTEYGGMSFSGNIVI